MSEDIKGPQVQRAIRQDAADRKHGMTLDEVAAFVDEARRQEVPGETIVSASDSTIANGVSSRSPTFTVGR